MVRHKVLVDAIAIAPYLAFSLATIRFYTRTPENLPASLYVTFTLVLLVPLAVRRRYPLAVFAVIASAAFVHWLLDVGLLPADLGVLVGMFTVAAHRRLVWSVAALATTELGLVLAVERWYLGSAILLPYSVFVVGLWLGGLYANMRRSYLAGLEERAARLERERDALAQVAAAEERERIARELHDVVAHNVSVMVVQADGGPYVIDRNSDAAKQALETISRTGREALTEMRRLLGVLRGRDGAGSGSAAGELAPQPGVDELAGLVEQVRSAGLPVELTVEGVRRPLDHGVGLATYRITQEALTNTLKHAPDRPPVPGYGSATTTTPCRRACTTTGVGSAPRRTASSATVPTAPAMGSSGCGSAPRWSAARWRRARGRAAGTGSLPRCRCTGRSDDSPRGARG